MWITAQNMWFTVFCCQMIMPWFAHLKCKILLVPKKMTILNNVSGGKKSRDGEGQGLAPTNCDQYTILLCIQPTWVQGGLQFPLYLCISQESAHYFPPHNHPLLNPLKVHNLQDSHPPHEFQNKVQTNKSKFKRKSVSRNRLVEREMAKTSCFRPPSMKWTFSLFCKRIPWIGNPRAPSKLCDFSQILKMTIPDVC